MDEGELNEIETKLLEKYHNGMKLIKESRERLLDDKLRCMICYENPKEVVIQPCLHHVMCLDANGLLKKECPRCQQTFTNVLKVKI